MFDSCWFELTSLDRALHGPPKFRHNPIVWSVTVCATQLYELVSPYAIAKVQLAEIAWRLYVTLGAASRESEVATNTELFP